MASARETFGDVLRELGRTDHRIIAMNADLSSSTKTSIFAKEFPERFFNMGIAEQNMMAAAAGLATTGKKVFASTFAVFATGRVYDQIRQSIAYPKLNVIIVATHGGITVGGDGASHQMVEDISLMRSLPNMVVVIPADAVETDRVIRYMAEHGGPAYIRLPRTKGPVLFSSDYTFEPGKGHVISDGSDITIMAIGLMVDMAIDAAAELEKDGISARVVNMSSVKPIDHELVVACARETGAIVTAEEHSMIGGLGSAVASVLAQEYPAIQEMVAIPDTFGESGESDELMEKYGLTVERIVEKAKIALQRKKDRGTGE
jgi:transketolase